MGSVCSNLLTYIQWQHQNAHMPSATHSLISGLSSQIPRPLFCLMLTLGRRPSRLPYQGAVRFVFFFPSLLGLGLMLLHAAVSSKTAAHTKASCAWIWAPLTFYQVWTAYLRRFTVTNGSLGFRKGSLILPAIPKLPCKSPSRCCYSQLRGPDYPVPCDKGN